MKSVRLMRNQKVSWPVHAIPRLVVAGRFPFDDRGFCVTHVIPAVGLHLYDYDGAIRMGEHDFVLRPGDLTVTPPQLETRYDLPRLGHHLCIHFAIQKLTPMNQRELISLPLHYSPPSPRQAETLRSQFIRIIGLAAEGEADPLARASASHALQDLLLTLARSARPAVATIVAPRYAEAAADRLAATIRLRFDRPLRVPELAREVGVSQNYLAKRFKDRYGQTIQGYIIRCRVEHAQLLLTTTDLPVSRIAIRVGMPDLQHFNKCFRRLVGRSPTAVRNAAPLGSRKDD